MKIISVIGKEIKEQMRNIGTLLIFVLMPLVLILILGITFGNEMEGDAIEVDAMTIEYMVAGDAGDLTDGFLTMMAAEALGGNNTVSRITERDASLNALADGQITCLVEVDENEKRFTIYKNSIFDTGAALVEAVLSTYVARYNAIVEIIKVNPAALAEIDLEAPAGDYSSLVALGSDNNLKSMDYYGIAMVVLFVMYGILQSLGNVFAERHNGTGNRTLMTALQKYEFFVGKAVGQILVLMIQLGLVVIFSTQVFGVSWGAKPLLPFLLVFLQVVMAVSIGIMMGLVLNTQSAGMTIGQIIVVVSAFFGGSYVPVSQLGDMAAMGRYFSPIWWVQSGIVNYIYLGETTTLYRAAMVCMGVTVVMFAIATIKLSRTEGLANA
ncbi:MAG: ABC transporter permease [Eubacteriales bacterium]